MSNFLVHNDGQHIHGVIGSTTCGKHKADVGMPCWVLPNSKNVDIFHYGICGKRIAKAGFNGKITPASLRGRGETKKSSNGARKPFKKAFAN